jgi:hypothetical protein
LSEKVSTSQDKPLLKKDLIIGELSNEDIEFEVTTTGNGGAVLTFLVWMEFVVSFFFE